MALTVRSVGEIQGAAAEVEGLGRRAGAVPIDATDEADVERFVVRVLEELGGLHVLVNNFGVIHVAPLTEKSLEDWDRAVGTNLRRTFLCTRAAGRYFLERGEGKVLNVASNFAFIGVPRFASKAGIVNLTRSAAIEWVSSGVQVNALAPGYVETDTNAAARDDEKPAAKIVGRMPSRRIVRVENLDPLVVYLASSASDSMTGETLVFDGGQAAR